MTDSTGVTSIQDEIEALQREMERLRRDQTCDDVASVSKSVFKYGGMAIMVYCGYLILAFAGDSMIADIMLGYISTLPVSQVAAYSAGITGVLFGFQQWRMLKKHETQSRARIAELEARITSVPGYHNQRNPSMYDQVIMPVLVASLAAAGVWAAYFWLYPGHRMATFRLELYELRDRLFDEAAEGTISFEHPAYVRLRRMMDGALRSDHRFFFSDAVTRLILAPRHSGHIETYLSDWYACISDLDEPVRQVMNDHLQAFHVAVGRHAALSMPILALNVLFMSNVVPVRVSCFSLSDIGSYLVVLNHEIRYAR